MTPRKRLSGITDVMGLQNENPNALSQDTLRTQRMTAAESRAVIDLWQQERVVQTGLTDQPAVLDVAEGLDVPVAEVQRLLGEVRRQRAELQWRQVTRQKQAALRNRWVQTKPGVWEDIYQQSAPPLASLGAKVSVGILCLVLSTAISVLACLVWILSSTGRN